jgi:hypothetical protein
VIWQAAKGSANLNTAQVNYYSLANAQHLRQQAEKHNGPPTDMKTTSLCFDEV